MEAMLHVAVPHALKRWVDDEAVRAGYPSAEEYVRHLLSARQARARLEEQLIEGLDSGRPTEVGADWQDRIRRAAEERRGHG